MASGFTSESAPTVLPIFVSCLFTCESLFPRHLVGIWQHGREGHPEDAGWVGQDPCAIVKAGFLRLDWIAMEEIVRQIGHFDIGGIGKPNITTFPPPKSA